jgi:diguanylate cyclase (GGDEF)-like protein
MQQIIKDIFVTLSLPVLPFAASAVRLKSAFAVLLLLVVLLQAGLAEGADHVVLQLRWLHQFQFAGYYAALEKGYYAREGLDVEIREANPGRSSPLDEVLQGNAQYGVGNSGLVASYQQGKPVVALAAVFQRSPNVWLSLDKSGIRTPQDLASKRLMMTRNVENAELLVMLANDGINVDRLNILPSSFNIQDLVVGKVDAFNAYSTNEPYLLKQLGLAYYILDPHDYGVDFYSDVLFTSQDELRSHPERVAAFRRASLAGWEYALAHPDEIVDLILSRYSQAKSRDHLLFEAKAIRTLMQPDLIEIGHMNPERWERIMAAYASLGMGSQKRNLENFLYRPAGSDWRWLSWTATGLALISLILALIVFTINRFNRKLKQEMDGKERARSDLDKANSIFLNVLDGVDVALYAVDAETLKVMFANATARKQFGDLLGQPCYSSLMGNAAPCPGCDAQAASSLKEVIRSSLPCVGKDFDFMLPATQRWFHASHKQVRWLDGRMALVGSAVDITSRKQREDAQEWLASHDPLTGLPNRNLLADRLQTSLALAKRRQTLVAVLFLDLDGFKPVNDSYGHDVGDELLVILANRIQNRLRASDTLARLGGDEFVMVIPITRVEELSEVLNRLAEDLRAPITLSSGVTWIDGSIGIAIYPDDGDTADALLRLADEAMYAVKRDGRGGYALREAGGSVVKVAHW